MRLGHSAVHGGEFGACAVAAAVPTGSRLRRPVVGIQPFLRWASVESPPILYGACADYDSVGNDRRYWLREFAYLCAWQRGSDELTLAGVVRSREPKQEHAKRGEPVQIRPGQRTEK